MVRLSVVCTVWSAPARAWGVWFVARIVTVTVSVSVRVPSLTVRVKTRSSFVVTVGAVNVGRSAEADESVTELPVLVSAHAYVTRSPSMSNDAEPSSVPLEPVTTVWSTPARAWGARFVTAVPCPSPTWMAFRMSPLSPSISHEKSPASPLERTYAPLARTESALS